VSFVRDLLLRGAGVAPAVKPRLPEVLPEVEAVEAAPAPAPVESNTATSTETASRGTASRSPSGAPLREAAGGVVQEQRAEARETALPLPPMPPVSPTPAVHRAPPAPMDLPDHVPSPLPEPAPLPLVVRETGNRIEAREVHSQVLRETRQAAMVSQVVRDSTARLVESKESVLPSLRRPEPQAAADLKVRAPEPVSVEVEIGSIEIVQAAPAAPPVRSPAARRPQTRGFAGLARQRQYADRRWY